LYQRKQSKGVAEGMAGRRLVVSEPTLHMTLYTISNLNGLQGVKALLLLTVLPILISSTEVSHCRGEARKISGQCSSRCVKKDIPKSK